MPSPDQDWGYDVSDYLGVHPELGQIDDVDGLIKGGGQGGMRVVLGLVTNHTSSQHPWFVESAASRQRPLRDYYVWADPMPGGGPPNNWLDFTGQSAWEWDASSGQYYLHNFLRAQPDLNWWQPAVHEEFRRILRFWFDRGVAGFRIDVAQGLYKDALLRDNPPSADDGPLAGRFGLRSVYSADSAASIVASPLAALPASGCPVWTASNHDVSRFPSRWCGGDEAKVKLALLVLSALPGSLVLYYGDEIGMTDVAVPPELARDTFGGQSGHPGRDRARTPMQWDDSASGGFTAPGIRGWLPSGGAAARNVAAQRHDPGSVLSFCREALSLRRERADQPPQGYERLPAPPGVWRYAAGELIVTANFTDRPVGLPAPVGKVLLSTAGDRGQADPAALAPWEGVISGPVR